MKEEGKVYLYKIEIKRCQLCNLEVNIKSISGYPEPSEKKCVSELMSELKKHFFYCKGYKSKSIIDFKLVGSKITKNGNLTTYSDDKSFQKLIL
jgi:hypothetical protein